MMSSSTASSGVPGAADRSARTSPRRTERGLLAIFRSSWFVGLLLALVSWRVAFVFPKSGLDFSWQYGIFAAAHKGLHFGTGVVFTYGPLGFLAIPDLWYGGLASLAFVYQSVLHLLLCVTLVFALREQLGVIGAALIGFVVLGLTSLADLPTVLAAAWCVTTLSEDPPPFALWLVTIGGALLGAISTLVEARPGPVIVLTCLVTLLARERRRRHLPVFFACLFVSLTALWFASGQALANLPDFVSNELQIVSGYSEAMGSPANGRLWLALLILVGIVGGTIYITGPELRRRLSIGLVVAVPSFALFKEGFVRADIGHTQIFFVSMLLLVAAARLFRGRRHLLVPAALAGLIVVNVGLRPRPPLSAFNPIQRVNQAVDQVHTLTSTRRQSRAEFYTALVMSVVYRLPPSYVALLHGHTVHLDPWDTAAAWVYDLDWDPAPVFQGYSAYTPKLDELNARALAASDGPQRILRENTILVDSQDAGLDGRLAVWDPPAEALAMLCNFNALLTGQRFQVLARVPDRCGSPRRAASISAQPGQTVAVPPAGPHEAIFARVHGLAVAGIERLETLAFRAHSRYAVINGTRRIRVVPGTAQDGMLFSLARGSDYPLPFSLSPGVRTISFTGGSGPLRIDLYRMSVAPR